MSIARFAVTRPVAVTMRIAALILLGGICLTRLPIDLLPKVTMPTVAVSTSWPNVAPEEMEAQITRPVERAVSTVPGMYEVSSTSSEGRSNVRIRFQWGTDIGQAAVDVLQAVERAHRQFPNDDTIQTPTVFKMDPNQMPILIFGVSGVDDPVKLRMILDNQIAPIVESAEGVAAINISGGQERAVIVDVDPVRLKAHHQSLSAIQRRLVQENMNLPAGIAKESNTEYIIRSIGWFGSIDEIKRVPLGTYNGHVVTVGDVADVRDEHSETRMYTRLDGKQSCALIVTKQSGANTVSTAQAVFDKIKEVEKLYPDMKFSLAYDQSKFIRESVHEVQESAIIGGVLAILILLFFLRNIRSTLVVALSIPTSIISTFALLYLCGFSINTMSLGGLALATGLIVDDAVVVLENIFRHIERDKKSATEAAISGTNEILSAVIASTWTVMVVFLPLLLIKGQSGQMFTQFALVVIFSIAVSLLDATTVVPMLATRLISGEAHAENANNSDHPSLIGRAFYRFGVWFDALDSSYRNALGWALTHRMIVIGAAVAITAASFLLKPMLGSELMPQTDSGDFSANIKLPVGTSVETTNKVMKKVEQIAMSHPDVATVFGAAGTTLSMRGGTTSLSSYEGSITVKLKEDRKKSTQDIMGDLRKQFSQIPGIRPRLNQFDLVTMLMTGGNQNIEINIFGDDLTTLSRLSKEVMMRVKDIPGLENVDVNWQEAMPEIQWRVDRNKASQLGVNFNDVAQTINTATNGTISSYYQEKGYQYPIIVRMPESERKTIEEMQNLVVTSSAGSEVLLRQVAEPVYGLGPSEITRLDRMRYIAVSGMPQGRSSGEVQADIEKAMAGVQLPEGYRWDWGSNQKRRSQEFGGMALAVVLAIGLIYMLLASQFESFVHPFTVLLSVPLSATGIILSLFLTNRSFGLTAFIGVLMLVGIVVKNGILLVDYTNVLRGRGIERDKALLMAGPTRLRPILMTASAAALGMLPIAIGLGSGSEIQAPMATVVIGGLITSTVMTLFVVPTAYAIIDDLALRLKRKGGAK